MEGKDSGQLVERWWFEALSLVSRAIDGLKLVHLQTSVFENQASAIDFDNPRPTPIRIVKRPT